MMICRAIAPLLLSLAVLSGPAQAHPHIFVDTGITLLHDAKGRLVAVRVTWTYDELFSLLLLEDKGLDADFDGKLTEAELEALQGFDMDWPEDFAGICTSRPRACRLRWAHPSRAGRTCCPMAA